MGQQVVILEADAAREDLHARVVAMGGRVVQAYGAQVWIVDVPEAAAEEGPARVGRAWSARTRGRCRPTVEVEDETGRLGIAAWNVRHTASFAATRANRVGEGRSWGDEGVEPEG